MESQALPSPLSQPGPGALAPVSDSRLVWKLLWFTSHLIHASYPKTSPHEAAPHILDLSLKSIKWGCVRLYDLGAN